MTDTPYIGYLHTSDGLSIVGPDGFADIVQLDAELEADDRPALEVPVIDVAPESVTDTETEHHG